MTGTDTDRCERMVFGHPPVLANLSGVEPWERFSFYGMQGILLIYLYYTADRGGLGINLGAFAGPLLTGLLQKNARYAIAVAVVSALAALWTRLGPRSSTAPTTRRHTSGRSVASP